MIGSRLNTNSRMGAVELGSGVALALSYYFKLQSLALSLFWAVQYSSKILYV
jgi:hypothetical protein